MQSGTLSVKTTTRMQFVDITKKIQDELVNSGATDGVCYIYNPHTTAAITINEGADPAVQVDIISALKEMVPLDYPYKHMEGNSPAHIMTSMVGSSDVVFIEGGRLKLGTWQKIFFCEFDGPRSRKVHWRIV